MKHTSRSWRRDPFCFSSFARNHGLELGRLLSGSLSLSGHVDWSMHSGLSGEYKTQSWTCNVHDLDEKWLEKCEWEQGWYEENYCRTRHSTRRIGSTSLVFGRGRAERWWYIVDGGDCLLMVGVEDYSASWGRRRKENWWMGSGLRFQQLILDEYRILNCGLDTELERWIWFPGLKRMNYSSPSSTSQSLV